MNEFNVHSPSRAEVECIAQGIYMDNTYKPTPWDSLTREERTRYRQQAIDLLNENELFIITMV